MELNIESIKALEPGKVYAVELDFVTEELVEHLVLAAQEYDIKLLLVPKGSLKFLSPEEVKEIQEKS
jgi:hypothetical protein